MGHHQSSTKPILKRSLEDSEAKGMRKGKSRNRPARRDFLKSDANNDRCKARRAAMEIESHPVVGCGLPGPG